MKYGRRKTKGRARMRSTTGERSVSEIILSICDSGGGAANMVRTNVESPCIDCFNRERETACRIDANGRGSADLDPGRPSPLLLSDLAKDRLSAATNEVRALKSSPVLPKKDRTEIVEQSEDQCENGAINNIRP